LSVVLKLQRIFFYTNSFVKPAAAYIYSTHTNLADIWTDE